MKHNKMVEHVYGKRAKITCKRGKSRETLDWHELNILLALVQDMQRKGDYSRFSSHKEAAVTSRRDIKRLEPKLTRMLRYSILQE